MHFDGSAIDGFSRVQESDVLAIPDPQHLRHAPVGHRETRTRRGCSATSPSWTARRSPATRARSSSATWTTPTTSATRSWSRRRWSSSTSAPPTPPCAPQPLDAGGYFDLTDRRRRPSDIRRRTIRTLEAMGIPVEYSFPRGQPVAARDRPALQRCALDGRTTS